MSDANYPTAFLHLVLAGSSLWTARLLNTTASKIVTTQSQVRWAYGALGLYVLKSCAGVFRFGHPDFGRKLKNIYDHILYVSTSLGFPCIATELYLYHSYQWNISLLHFASGVIPLIFYALDGPANEDWQKIAMALNVASVSYLGFVHENYFAIATALSYGLIYFGIKNQGQHGDVPSLDLFLVGLCFCNFFTYRALTF